jgi:hypothetical protein
MIPDNTVVCDCGVLFVPEENSIQRLVKEDEIIVRHKPETPCCHETNVIVEMAVDELDLDKIHPMATN